MTAQSGLGFSGIVAINIPVGGAVGTVLTKLSSANYDYDWQPGGAATTSLQDAYDNAPAPPQITVNAGQPVTIDLPAAANDVFALRDEAANDILRVNDTRVTLDVPQTIDQSLATGSAQNILLTDTVSVGAFVGGCIQSTGTITYTASTFIWALLQESKGYIANVGPGFAAFTLFNAIPFIRNGTNNALVQALVLNVGVSHQSTGANAVTTVGTTGMSFSPNTRALTAGGSVTKTSGDTAVRVSPTFGTVAGSSINFGTIRGMHCFNPAVALFQPGAGTESMVGYIGVDIEPIPFGGNVLKRGFRSNLVAASNTRAIECAGTAQSDFNGSINFPVDLVGIQMGTGLPFFMSYGAAAEFFWQWNVSGDQLRWSNPATNRYILQTENGNDDGEFNLGFSRFSFGQTGAVGNQVGNFVANTRTIGVAGEWADFLLTQAGSLTVGGLAMSRVSAWVINGVSYAASTGSVTEADTLTVAGFPTSSPGVTITDRQSLHVIAGRSRFDSSMQYEPISPATLAAGDTNDYGGLLTGTNNNGMRHFARLSGDAGGTSRITGIDATQAQDGECFKLCNVSANNITLANQNAGSAAANRIITGTGADYVLNGDENCEIIYDATTARWRLLYGTGA